MDPQQANLVPPQEQPQPIGQQFAPTAPAQQPAGVPGVQPELSQEEMQQNLSDMMAKIDSIFLDMNSGNASNAEELQSQKDVMLKEVFDLFVKMGVDPSNVEEVRTFLDGIKANNPELYQKIEKALGELIGGDTTQSVDQTQAPVNQSPLGGAVA